MLILLSPAKTLDETPKTHPGTDLPRLRKKTTELVSILKGYSPKKLGDLMHISEKLAVQNHERYQNFSSRYTPNNSKASLHAFKGDVYVGLDAGTMSKKDLSYAQDHLRILSGLYGVLKPMDKMQPYRLEMGTGLKNPEGKDLYKFWGSAITDEINNSLRGHKDKTIINLASNEYFKAVDKKLLKAEVLDIGFKEDRNGKLTFVSFNAKKARGVMARYIIRNRVENKEELKGFDVDGYRYVENLSNENHFMFIK